MYPHERNGANLLPRQMNMQCPNCGQPFPAVVETVIDAEANPQAKMSLLAGRLNAPTCPNCGARVNVAAPLVYHDGSKQLLITYVPMELGLTHDQQEKAIGDLMRELTQIVPQNQMGGYMFNPRQALTMQGLIEQVLKEDGVTQDMLDQQRQRVTLIEQLLNTEEDQLESFVQQHDSEIDAQFFQTLSLMAQRMVQDGRPDVAEQMLLLQQIIAEYSSFGQQLIERNRVQEQVLAEVAQDVQALGENATRDDFLQLAVNYAGDEDRLQALVGLVRPAFDYEFFENLTMQISQAPAAARDQLEALRERLLQLTALVDQQTQMALQEAVGLLRELLNTQDLDEAVRANAAYFDDTFMTVLTANIQESERQGDINASSRLKAIYEKVMSVLRDTMQPELRLINEMLSTETDEEAVSMLQQQGAQYGESLIEMMDAVERVLAQRGDGAMRDKLHLLRQQAEQLLR